MSKRFTSDAPPDSSTQGALDACATLGVGVVVLDEQLVVTEMNAYAISVLGLTGAVGGESLRALLGEDEFSEISWMFAVVLRCGEMRRCTVSLVAPNTVSRQLLVSLAPQNEAGHWLLGLVEVTDDYQLLLGALQAEKAAAVGLLAAGIAHEFNNIWASIQGYAELARNDQQFQQELVGVALGHSARSIEIIHALLSFSNQQRSPGTPLQLGDLLKSILRLIHLELKTNNVTAELTIEDDPYVQGNEGMFQQVFLHLLTNAFQAIEGKGEVHVTVSQERGFAVVRVRDTGVGMDEDEVKHLFDPFYTTKGALGGNEDVSGQGLGLTLARNFVVTHGGDIGVSSTPGEGSVFTVRIPQVAESDQASESVEVRDEAAASSMPLGEVRRQILALDDEPILLSVLVGVLEDHEVDCVLTVAEAREKMAATAYEILILDLVLSDDDDGFVFFDEVARHYPAVQVLLLTGRVHDAKLEEYAKRAAGLLKKPFTAHELVEIVASIPTK